MAQYKPYEAPQYMKDYSETATSPFARSALGQFLANKEAEELMDDRYEQPIDADMPETGVPEEGIDMSSTGNWITDALAYTGGRQVLKTGVQKGILNKLAKKGVTRAAGYFVPGAGQVMLAADIGDFFLPEGYSPYEGFGLAPNNPVSNVMSFGNVQDVINLYDEYIGEE